MTINLFCDCVRSREKGDKAIMNIQINDDEVKFTCLECGCELIEKIRRPNNE